MRIRNYTAWHQIKRIQMIWYYICKQLVNFVIMETTMDIRLGRNWSSIHYNKAELYRLASCHTHGENTLTDTDKKIQSYNSQHKQVIS